MMDLFLTNMQLFSSQDMLTDVLEWCRLLWCIYQLFGLSFWRHPFTAEDPLVMAFSENFDFWVNSCFKRLFLFFTAGHSYLSLTHNRQRPWGQSDILWLPSRGKKIRCIRDRKPGKPISHEQYSHLEVQMITGRFSLTEGYVEYLWIAGKWL